MTKKMTDKMTKQWQNKYFKFSNLWLPKILLTIFITGSCVWDTNRSSEWCPYIAAIWQSQGRSPGFIVPSKVLRNADGGFPSPWLPPNHPSNVTGFPSSTIHFGLHCRTPPYVLDLFRIGAPISVGFSWMRMKHLQVVFCSFPFNQAISQWLVMMN